MGRLLCALALAVGAALPAQGGGPLQIVNHQGVVYPNGGTSLTLNLDQGPLGNRSNAQAVALVQAAIGMWNGVATSTMRLAIGPQLAADYTTANFATVFGKFSDGLNPVIFDTDGSITDLIFGAGAHTNILGFAGSSYFTSGPSAGTYREGQAVLNGAINISDATWTTVFAHEIGHYFGLDHSQLDGTQGLPTSNYVLMYPVAYRTQLSLHEDDAAAVSALYPTAGIGTVYGQLTGTFTTAAGTPILGANIWAKETTTGKVYSVVSDFLLQGTGYYRMYLPAGTYTLNAESISTAFYGGSGVGPYSDTTTDISFLAPHPIAPVAYGGASPTPVTIVAGCLATSTFRVDGSGSVGGNCTAPPPTVTTLGSSQNPAVAGSTVTLTATVTGIAPTGTVTFSDGGLAIGGCTALPLSGAGNVLTAACALTTLPVGTRSIVAAYSGDSANSASGSLPLGQVITASTAPVLVSAVSRKVHGAAGAFSLPLALTPGNPTTEPRSGAATALVLTFDRPVASASAAVTEGAATLGAATAAGSDVTVNLTGVANAQYLTIALTNVAATGGGTLGSGSVRVGFLVGDVNGSRSVTIADLLAVNAVLTQAVSASNFTRDVNVNGTLSLADNLTVSNSLARSLPAP